MKLFSSLVALSLSFALVDAFPALDTGNIDGLTPATLDAAIKAAQDFRKAKRLLVDVSKPIGITGKHAFKPPSETDQRGPCPGLNALANHAYISRTGVTTFAEVVTAINQVMGMGIELSLVLGVMGTVWTGSAFSLTPGFSIGGSATGDGSENVLGNLFGVLGRTRGLQGSHNWLESDASLTRDDLYVTGDASTMNMTLFRDIHDRADEDGIISMELLAEQATRRWEYSVANNPAFYYGPVTGMVSRNAGYFFLGRLLSNHTAENPDGVLTQEIFRKFFGVYKNEKGDLVYRKGHETIPDNWYRKPIEYGLVPLNLDIVGWVTKHPVLGSIGGNTGTVNSFSGLDLHNITSGVLNASSLLEKNNLMCFVLQLLKTFLPNSLSPLLATIEIPIDLVTSTIASPLLSLACPAWRDLTEGGEPLWDAIQQRFEGARKAGSSL